MTIWAISDPHLFFSTPDKNMNIFGPAWEGYTDRMEQHWKALIKNEDLVLIPGDISWAMHLEDALTDLRWIDSLPGTKVILRGNHDYWWSSNQKMAKVMPPTIHFIHNNAFLWKDVAIGGSRLWDSRSEYTFDEYVHFQANPKEKKKDENIDSEKIFLRELDRLKLSLSQMSASAKVRIALTHYP
ncbi:MAG TPA: metallophosphoesterase, partial [Rhabdochlamydiaceae bacterium]